MVDSGHTLVMQVLGFMATNKQTLGDLQEFKTAMQIHVRCNGLGPIAVVLTEPEIFRERVLNAVRRLTHHRIKLVDYYDEESVHGLFDEEEDIPFKKRMLFKPQREYRIAVDTGSKTPGQIALDIGDNSDITMVMSREEFNKTVGSPPS